VRIAVRVQPGASRTVVGGQYGTSDPPVLLVRVTERAVDGRANRACEAAIAAALGVPRRGVRIVVGESSRSKVVEVDGADPAAVRALLQECSTKRRPS
jgi:uncharacterized protein YggU (UPF0235/DUF167 family)